MKEKTIILSSTNKTSEKAVLNLEKTKEGYDGNIRLYNFKEIPRGILTLGFLIDKEVVKTALSEKSKDLYSFQLKTNKVLENFTCALVLIHNGDASPLLCGSTFKSSEVDLPLELSKNFDILDDSQISASEVENRLNQCGIDYEEEEKEEIEKAINKNLCEENKCANCSYRNAFYSTNSKTSPIVTQKSESAPLYPNTFVSQSNFYDEIKGQISLLFERYPEETFLNEIIPNSKWVKVDYEDNGEYFVVGLLYENGNVAYVCYGMPGEFSVEPPRELSGISQWLPLDPEKPNELGYWLMYQDAETGESVEIKIS